MASVDADTHTALVVHPIYNAGNVLKPPSKVGTLPCGILYHGGYALGLRKCKIYFAGYLVKALLLADFVEVRTGMEIKHGKPQLLCSTHLVEKRRTAFGQRLLVGRTKVD